MSFWDRIKRWLSGKQEPAQAASVPPVKDRPVSVPIVDQSSGDLPSPGNAAIDIFRLLFSNKDKHTTLMLNSISLSSDMKTLYLIDNGRAISFDLTVPQGVIVGLLGDQLVVATGSTVAIPQDTPTTGGAVIDTSGSTKGGGKTYTFKAGEDSQYTLSYNGKNKALGIIGVDDVVIHLEAPEEGTCSEQIFSLENKKIARIKWAEGQLTVTEMN
jgi:hypothetical protein